MKKHEITNAKPPGFQRFGTHELGGVAAPLKRNFTMPPFSTWNTRDGDWQDRARAWKSLGIKSELGRDGKLTFNIPLTLSDGRKGNKIDTQTSVFDPVVCELVYQWWCRTGGTVLDPFAGGSVRGIVASRMGLKYYGIELRGEQVEANRTQRTDANTGEFKPRWTQGDSTVATADAPRCDLVFSCPPYGNLEVYSDHVADISNKEYGEFMGMYAAIIKASVARLRDNRFACFVVANFRNPRTGIMHDFVGDTVRAFRRAGLQYYNDIIIINTPGSGPMRTNNTFVRGHGKAVKMHQNVLVFVKGDPALAAEGIPMLDATRIAKIPKDDA